MNEELKPCPFCGKKASIFCNGVDYEIDCRNKGCRVVIHTHASTKRTAVANWNKRAQKKPE